MSIGTGDFYDNSNDHYPELEHGIKFNFNNIPVGTPLFTTSAEELFDRFLDKLPANARQHYTCNACRQFVNRFGGLVTIDEAGNMSPVMWDYNVPTFFIPAVNAIIEEIQRSKVTGVFLSSDKTWGIPQTGEWTHLAVIPTKDRIFKERLNTAGQKMAEKREDYRMLQHAIQEYGIPTVEQAITLLQANALYRSEKLLGIAEWFLGLKNKRAETSNTRLRNNIVWHAVATAPAGFTHIRSSMIGTLLDDIQSGMEFATVKRRFDEKMHPLKYQRPQAAPSAGNIAQAERIVEQLGIARSLERRFARLDELLLAWKPTLPKTEEQAGGVFGHLKPKNTRAPIKAMELPAVTMTWRKFAETVLPNALSIEYQVKAISDNFTALLTAVHEDAPPILQWDTEEQRNPFNWYVYNGGSRPSQWGVTSGWNKVTGIVYQPSMWREGFEHQGKSVNFILDGAVDTKDAGIALFPEILKSELREIRSTIEAHSRSGTLQGREEASACGVRFQNGSNWNCNIRVTTATGVANYKLDRWD